MRSLMTVVFRDKEVKILHWDGMMNEMEFLKSKIKSKIKIFGLICKHWGKNTPLNNPFSCYHIKYLLLNKCLNIS